MKNVARSAGEAAEAARRVLAHLEESDRAVDDTAGGMTRIDAAVSETAEKMRLLGERSEKVFAIIDLIDDIAARSELLSLNAAIEAAHAGDAGKGFGVVAEEISHLAERSMTATRDVTAIVKGIASETRAALSAMESSMREVKQGLGLSESARARFREIGTLVQRATELSTHISAASDEQTQAVQTAVEAIQTIALITEESAMGAGETAKAVSDLVTLAEQLNTAISRFRIDRPVEVDAKSPDGRADIARALQALSRDLSQAVGILRASEGTRSGDAGHASPAAGPDALAAVLKSLAAVVSRLDPGDSNGKRPS